MGVLLNVDLGELACEPADFYEVATAVNVACGGHAGDEATMTRACRLAKLAGVRLFAHPSYPDRAGFGRVSMSLSSDELSRSLLEQLSGLRGIAGGVGIVVQGVKAHGALYHDAAKNREVAARLLEAVEQTFPRIRSLVGPGESELRKLAEQKGLGYLREGFADRRYADDGSLVPRTEPGALLTTPWQARRQALRLLRSGSCDSLCVHSDTPGALEIARAVRELLESEGALE